MAAIAAWIWAVVGLAGTAGIATSCSAIGVGVGVTVGVVGVTTGVVGVVVGVMVGVVVGVVGGVVVEPPPTLEAVVVAETTEEGPDSPDAFTEVIL